jgi:hypothetical protein
MADFINLTFLSYFKVLIVAILIYAIIYAMLIKIDIFGAKKEVNALIALLAAIIVSFTGVVTYAVSYAINWFVIIIFIIFLLMVLLMFLGVSSADIAGQAKDKAKPILIVFFILFALIIIKGFFALNNAFDINNPQEDQYDVDTRFNTGVDDMFDGNEQSFINKILSTIDRDIWASVLFLLVIGVFVMIIGRS